MTRPFGKVLDYWKPNWPNHGNADGPLKQTQGDIWRHSSRPQCSSFQIITDGSAEWTCPHLTEKLPDSVCPQYPYVQFYTIATQQCHQSV